MEIDFDVNSTSASTPVFGGIISLLNSYMFNNGKTSIGFANPLLYKMYADNPSTFNGESTRHLHDIEILMMSCRCHDG